MAKKELTLEELQARKSKRQRGWVRVCAIILAISLTAGIYFIGSKGGPRKQKLSPNVVQVNGNTIIQKTDAPATDDEVAPTPEDKAPEEGGGILDTIMGLLGGFDPSSIMDMLGPIFDQLGGLAGGGGSSDKIDDLTDKIIGGIDKIEGEVKPITAPTRPVEEIPFDFITPDVLSKETAVKYFNAFTQKVVDEKAGYTLSRANTYAENGNTDIGSKTQQANDIIGKVTQGKYGVDDIVLAFTNGTKDGSAKTVIVCTGQTAASAIKAYDKGNPGQYAHLQLAAIQKTALTTADINNVQTNTDGSSVTFTFDVKGLKNPDRKTTTGIAGITQDFLVRDEVAKKLKDATSIKGNEMGLLKLLDLDLAYENVTVTVTFDAMELAGGLFTKDGDIKAVPTSVQLKYDGRGKFVVRNNVIKVTGKATTVTTTEYNNFFFE